MVKCCRMKLDAALKLYIALYFICFLFSWFVSVPMLLHVSEEGECLLFVSPYIEYGSSASKLYYHCSITASITYKQFFILNYCMFCYNLHLNLIAKHRLLVVRTGLYGRFPFGYHTFRASHHAIGQVEDVSETTRSSQL